MSEDTDESRSDEGSGHESVDSDGLECVACAHGQRISSRACLQRNIIEKWSS